MTVCFTFMKHIVLWNADSIKSVLLTNYRKINDYQIMFMMWKWLNESELIFQFYFGPGQGLRFFFFILDQSEVGPTYIFTSSRVRLKTTNFFILDKCGLGPSYFFFRAGAVPDHIYIRFTSGRANCFFFSHGF